MIAEAATLAWAAELRGCEDGARRERLLLELRKEAGELDRWLRRAWDWLDRNPAAYDYERREDQFLDRLRVYERASAAVALAELRDGGRS